MKQHKYRTMLIRLVAAVVLVSSLLTMSGFSASAFDNSALRHLPYTGAAWKTWRQGDSQWGNQHVGTSSSSATMSQIGCVVTSMATMARSYGATLCSTNADVTSPLVALNKMKGVGALEPDGDYVWGNTDLVFNGLTYVTSHSGLSTQSALLTSMQSYLNSSLYEYACVICFSGDHYVLFDHATSSGTVYVFDPSEGDVCTLSTALGRKSYYTLSGYFVLKWTSSSTLYMRGDVNNDTNVTTADNQLISSYLLGTGTLTDTQKKSADFNGNGIVSFEDISLMSYNESNQ